MITIYGGPTTGKTTFSNFLKGTGVKVADTDDLMEEVIADLLSEGIITCDKPWRGNDEERLAYEKAMEAAFPEWLEDQDGADYLLTNYWGLLCKNGIKAELGVYRLDSNEVNELSKSRGGTEIPIEVAERWAEDAKNGKIEQCIGTKLIQLKKGQYLQDVASEYFGDQEEVEEGEEF